MAIFQLLRNLVYSYIRTSLGNYISKYGEKNKVLSSRVYKPKRTSRNYFNKIIDIQRKLT